MSEKEQREEIRTWGRGQGEGQSRVNAAAQVQVAEKVTGSLPLWPQPLLSVLAFSLFLAPPLVYSFFFTQHLLSSACDIYGHKFADSLLSFIIQGLRDKTFENVIV